MGEATKIEWCHHTFNPWIGCTKVHEGCTNCYAEADMDKRRGRVKWGPNGTRSKTSESNWREPLKWNREAEWESIRKRVFCASLADIFEDWDGPIVDHLGRQLFHENFGYTHDPELPAQRDNPCEMEDLRGDLFRLIDRTPWLDWLLLTKRPENVRQMLMPWLRSRMGAGCESPDDAWKQGIPVKNLWIGTSISNQETADRFIPQLNQLNDLASVLFLSCEPLLDSIDLYTPIVDWVIIGGESGPHARPCRLEWIQSLVRQCARFEVPCFVKQLGAKPVNFYGEQLRYEDKKGGDIDTWPAGLQVRQFPSSQLKVT